MRLVPSVLPILAVLASPALGLVLGGCAASGPGPEHTAIKTDRLEPYECGEITRLHAFGGIFLASQPSAEDLAVARSEGVRTVVDMRGVDEDRGFDERAEVTSLGLRYVALPWSGVDELTDEVFDRSRALFQSAERPMLVHCSSANRVGAAWLAWRVLDGGLSFDDALAEARTIGLRTPGYVERAREYVGAARPGR